MKRLFVGIRISPELQSALARRQGGLEGARWVAPENFHITLFYIGEVPDDAAREAALVLSRIKAAPFTLQLGGEDFFGNRRPHALFTRIEKSESLENLALKVRHAVLPLAESKETRKFTPHITLAYLKGLAEDVVMRHLSAQPLYAPLTLQVEAFELIESHLRNEGPIYQTLAEFPLKA
ncbi:MAG: RNA 2',3'-cyclic phosphodiesterase [Alphaproteobacteria bacterium]|nr:MAG: RNA 2',3'-cyclic phosphodiesterase [Alphaproteobacteria bacterium]